MPDDLNLDPSHDETTWDLATILNVDNISSGPSKQPQRRRNHTKRASHACSRCRVRKVRCDVSVHGYPCSNCSWEEVVCMDAGPRKQQKKKKSKDYASGTRGEEKGQESTVQGSEDSSCSVVEMSSHQEPSPRVLTENRTCDSSAPIARLPDSSNALSPIFSPLPTTLSVEDIHYLKKKDALSIPQRQLRGKLFNSYVSSVHPHMPFLDLRHFADVIGQQEIEKKVGLLLFQAVMLAGCASVDMQHLLEAGFQTRAEAQKIFFNRVKLLYDFDVETDSLDTVQALLLLAQSRPSLTVSGTKDRWHWLGVAISMAYTIDLHRSASHRISHSEITYEDKHLRRRVWWTCFMLDRLVAVMEGKPTRIWKEDCSAELLRLEDFDVERPIDSIDGKNNFWAEDSRDTAEVYMARLFMCWSFDDRTPHQSAIVEQQTYDIINTPDTILSNSDASPIDSDYWADEVRGCASSYTGSTGTESVTTCNAENCLSNLWVSEFGLEDDSELLGLRGENEAVESKTGYGSMDLGTRQLCDT